MSQIAYREGYEYQLEEDYAVAINIRPPAAIKTRYVRLTQAGRLVIKNGYCWDGPSGPAIDTKNFMRGSLVHDALYQLMRAGFLDHNVWRARADEILREIFLEDALEQNARRFAGVKPKFVSQALHAAADTASKARAWWIHLGVRFGGGPAVDPANETPILRAP